MQGLPGPAQSQTPAVWQPAIAPKNPRAASEKYNRRMVGSLSNAERQNGSFGLFLSPRIEARVERDFQNLPKGSGVRSRPEVPIFRTYEGYLRPGKPETLIEIAALA